jgi:hypothetical protein
MTPCACTVASACGCHQGAQGTVVGSARVQSEGVGGRFGDSFGDNLRRWPRSVARPIRPSRRSWTWRSQESPSSAASGGRSWVAASHTTAAVRMAKSLETPMPTPVATAQLSASAQDERRSAGTGGREACPSCFHALSVSRWVTNPASAPAP